MDLFTVSEDGKELTVNAKWLQHLQERLLGEDGHPRKVRYSLSCLLSPMLSNMSRLSSYVCLSAVLIQAVDGLLTTASREN